MTEEISEHKIMEMEPLKRERILNAAMAEFSAGYAKASTDAIVRGAGISKGLLFHYFGTKEKLYEFVAHHAAEVLITEFYSLMNFSEPDLLERIWRATLLKMDLSYKYPAIFDFVAAVYLKGGSDDIFFTKYLETQGEFMSRLTDGVDTALFKDGIDAEKAINIIMWATAGYANSQVTADLSMEDFRKDYSRLLDEMKEYFDLFRKIFYKEE